MKTGLPEESTNQRLLDEPDSITRGVPLTVLAARDLSASSPESCGCTHAPSSPAANRPQSLKARRWFVADFSSIRLNPMQYSSFSALAAEEDDCMGSAIVIQRRQHLKNTN